MIIVCSIKEFVDMSVKHKDSYMKTSKWLRFDPSHKLYPKVGSVPRSFQLSGNTIIEGVWKS